MPADGRQAALSVCDRRKFRDVRDVGVQRPRPGSWGNMRRVRVCDGKGSEIAELVTAMFAE